jgi:carbon monoxide dehydrogenase subunit G
MPQLRQSFSVPQGPDEVWRLLDDIPQVAQCMPGAELASFDGQELAGRLKVKLGPVSAAFEGTAQILDRDEGARRTQIKGQGVDRSGGSRAGVTVSYWVEADGDSSKVVIEADISLQGALAQFGRTSIIQDVSDRLTAEFAKCLEAKLAASSEEEAAEVKASEVPAMHLAVDGAMSLGRSMLHSVLRTLASGLERLAVLVRRWSDRF